MSASFPVVDDSRWRVSTATAGQVNFTVPFAFQRKTDVLVWRQDLAGLIHVLTVDVDYAISGAGSPAGGTVTLSAGAAAGEKIYRIGEADLDRLTSVVRNGKYSSEALDDDLDRMIIALMEFRRDNERSWKVGFGQQAGIINLGAAGTVAMFDQNGGISEGPKVSDVASAQGYAEAAIAAAGAASASAGSAVSSASTAAGAAGVAADAAVAATSAADLVLPLAADIQTAADNIAAIQAAPAAAAAAATSATAAAASQIAAETAANGVTLSVERVGRVSMCNGPVEPGCLRMGEGGNYDRASFPQLAAWMDANGAAAFGLTGPQIAAGALPDWRDYSPRTAGGALGPAVGAKQEDALQNVTGIALGGGGTPYNGDTGATGPFRNEIATGSFRPTLEATSSGNRVSFDLSRVARTATETRVKSFGVRWQIRAFGVFVNDGTADLVAMQQDIQTVKNGAVRKDIDQNAQAESPAYKINILKNTLQVWELVANGIQKVAGNVASVTWTGLGDYRELRLRASCLPTLEGGLQFRAGVGAPDSGPNYLYQTLRGSAAVASASYQNSLANGPLSFSAAPGSSSYSPIVTPEFTDFNQAVACRYTCSTYSYSPGAGYSAGLIGGAYSGAANRNLLQLFFSSGLIAAGSIFVLEGMRG